MTSMNDTPSGNRLHIAIFGRRNAGKSSIINALTNQDAAIVSAVAGTTTDPVRKAMEILPIGPVVIVDTAGIDDVGELGEKRIKKALRILDATDLALLIVDASEGGPDAFDTDLVAKFKQHGSSAIVIANQVDLATDVAPIEEFARAHDLPFAAVSAATRQGIENLKQVMIANAPKTFAEPTILGDLINPHDFVVCVVPVDKAAPKGRLILPQVMAIRDIIDHDASAVVVKERELRDCLANLGRKPKLVVTDSQAILKASADTPRDIWFTTFSILFARFKGDLEAMARGARAIETLKPGSRVLIAEACTHHRVPDDIGNVQIPRWLRQFAGGELEFEWVSGNDYPENLDSFDLVVHCGACMINRTEMMSRIHKVETLDVPITNYGVLLAYVHGVLDRALEPFPLAQLAFEEG